MPTIQEAVQAAAPGDIVKIPAGVYDVSDLVLPSDITLQADGDATLVGNLIVNGSNTVVQGFTFDGGFVDLWNSHGATVRDCVFNGGQASVNFSGADGALITSNDFNNVAGNVLDGWDLNQSTISGNHFTNCWQCINLDFNNDPTRGNDVVIDHNTFINTARMPIEVGPGETARTSNLVISNNWSDNSHVTDQASDGAVAYSIISTYGDHTLIEGNYAKGPSGPGIGIELAGSGEISNNSIDTFEFGIIVYGSGFNVHDNATANTPIESVLNYSGGDGIIQNNIADAEGVDLAANAHYGQSSDEGSNAALLDTGTPAEQQPADGGLDGGWQNAAEGGVQADGADAQDVASQWIDPAPLDTGTSADQQLADVGLDAGLAINAAMAAFKLMAPMPRTSRRSGSIPHLSIREPPPTSSWPMSASMLPWQSTPTMAAFKPMAPMPRTSRRSGSIPHRSIREPPPSSSWPMSASMPPWQSMPTMAEFKPMAPVPRTSPRSGSTWCRSRSNSLAASGTTTSADMRNFRLLKSRSELSAALAADSRHALVGVALFSAAINLLI